jgi:predicted dehydrogenase
MTRQKIKKLIRQGAKVGKVKIAQAIFDHWKLGERTPPKLPYKD